MYYSHCTAGHNCNFDNDFLADNVLEGLLLGDPSLTERCTQLMRSTLQNILKSALRAQDEPPEDLVEDATKISYLMRGLSYPQIPLKGRTALLTILLDDVEIWSIVHSLTVSDGNLQAEVRHTTLLCFVA